MANAAQPTAIALLGPLFIADDDTGAAEGSGVDGGADGLRASHRGEEGGAPWGGGRTEWRLAENRIAEMVRMIGDSRLDT